MLRRPATRSKSASHLGKLRGVSPNPRRTPSSKSAPASMGTSRKATKNKTSKSKGKRANNSNSQLESVSILIYPGDSSTKIIKNYFTNRRPGTSGILRNRSRPTYRRLAK